MADHTITHFPVGNGDCSRIRLTDGTQIVIDCNFTEASQREDDPTRYDVHSHLLREAKRLPGNVPHVDAFILTHADMDHCRGFAERFYTGDPARYDQRDQRRGRLLIDELWFTPRIFYPHEELCDDAAAFRREAKRRMELHRLGSPAAGRAGNRIRIIGHTDNPDLRGLEHLVTVPGTFISVIDGKAKADFGFFVHAPFKWSTDNRYAERNETSVVLQARFAVRGVSDACLVLFAGDADCVIFRKIQERSRSETLAWDLFIAPHHCSWTFFSEEPYKDNQTPAASSLAFLTHARQGARVVASCKPLRNDDDNPPHWAAAQLYKRAVGERNFTVLAAHPTERRPLPLEFTITEAGPMRQEAAPASAIASSAAISSAVSIPKTYG